MRKRIASRLSHSRPGFLTSLVSDILLFTVLFPAMLRLKFILSLANDLMGEILATIEVGVAAFTAVITLAGIVWLFRDRTIAGRHFTVAAISGGVLLVVISSLMILGMRFAAIGLETFIFPGLLIGNAFIIACNIAIFYSKLPAM